MIESLTPTITSWFAQRDAFAFDTKRLDPAPDARRFEGGSPPMPNIYMARPALDLLTEHRNGERGGANRTADSRLHRQAFAILRIESKTPASSVGPLVVLRS